MLFPLAVLLSTTIVELAPSSNWVVNYADDSCIAQRAFGPSDAQQTLGFQQLPLSRLTDIIVISDKMDLSRPNQSKLTISAAALPPKQFGFESNSSRQTGRGIMKFTIGAKDMDLITQSGDFLVQIKNAKLHFAVGRLDKVMQALNHCTQQLLAEWHVDQSEVDRIKEWPTPKADSGAAIDLLLRNVKNGDADVRVPLLLAISEQGHVTECRVLDPRVPAQSAKQLCDALIASGRFEPARDAQGRAIAAHTIQGVRWSYH